MQLRDFVEKHELMPPGKEPENDDQLRLLTSEDGVVNLDEPDALDSLSPTVRKPGTPEGRCLWVITEDHVPAIVERAPRVRVALKSGVAKHTNLTGGGSASCGGELWVDPSRDQLLWVTGGSGRYRARSPAHLNDAVAVLSNLGYEIKCAGWSTDNDWPERVFREG